MLRAEQVDLEHPAGVSHGRRDAGRVDEGAEGARAAHAVGDRVHRVPIGHVAGLADGAVDGGLVEVDGDDDVGDGPELLDAGATHAAARAGDDDDAHV